MENKNAVKKVSGCIKIKVKPIPSTREKRNGHKDHFNVNEVGKEHCGLSKEGVRYQDPSKEAVKDQCGESGSIKPVLVRPKVSADKPSKPGNKKSMKVITYTGNRSFKIISRKIFGNSKSSEDVSTETLKGYSGGKILKINLGNENFLNKGLDLVSKQIIQSNELNKSSNHISNPFYKIRYSKTPQCEDSDKSLCVNFQETPSNSNKREKWNIRYDCGNILHGQVCRKSFSANAGKDIFTCEICEKSFDFLGTFNEHMLSHSDLKLFICGLCEKAFNQEADLKHHILSHSGQQMFCELCDKSFTRYDLLRNHIASHSEENSVMCDICNKMLKSKNILKQHMKCHSDHKPYKCEVCDKSFKQSAHLKRHKFSHGNVKPYVCQLCFKSFKYKSNLNDHGVSHTEDKTFKCRICERAFHLKRTLKQHMVTHFDDKPFKCELCGKSYKRRCEIRLHMMNHSHSPKL